jgi:hydroxyacylglutathione hydrolase
MHIMDGLHIVLFPSCGIGAGCNVYAIRTEEGVAIIDGGLQPAIRTIEEQLNLFGMRLADVRLLIATHCHFDHYETFREIREISGARILAHTKDAEVLEAGDYRTGWHVRGVFGLRPAPPAPLPVDQRLEDGEIISLGEVNLEVVHTPGHTHGSICLYTTLNGKKALFSGDVVCPSPQSGGMTGWIGSPTLNIEAYRKSMLRLCELDVDCLFGGHENPCMKDGWRPISSATNRFLIDHPVSSS